MRHTHARAHEDRGGSAIRTLGHALIRYLCDESIEDKRAWTRKLKDVASKLVGVYYDPRTKEWTLLNGWKRRLRAAGLDEECNVVDEAAWERAYRQLIERGNFDPAIARIEEALEPEKGQDKEETKADHNASSKDKEAIHKMTLKGKFGNV
jgi:hypothetical protein